MSELPQFSVFFVYVGGMNLKSMVVFVAPLAMQYVEIERTQKKSELIWFLPQSQEQFLLHVWSMQKWIWRDCLHSYELKFTRNVTRIILKVNGSRYIQFLRKTLFKVAVRISDTKWTTYLLVKKLNYAVEDPSCSCYWSKRRVIQDCLRMKLLILVKITETTKTIMNSTI